LAKAKVRRRSSHEGKMMNAVMAESLLKKL